MATNERKYLSWDKLQKYDAKLKAKMAADIAAAVEEAEGYADSLASNYDAAGSAAGVQSNLNTEIARAEAAEAAALAAAENAQSEVDALESLVGSLPSGSGVSTVVAYVDKKTAGIATESALSGVQGQVNTLKGRVDDIEADYLKAADKTEVLDTIAEEVSRATGVEGGLNTRLAAVEADYLKAADKTELADTIADHKGILDAVKEDVDAFFKDATISEAAKDTLKEIQNYIDSDVQGAAAMTESIQKNAQDISGVAGRVGTLEGEMDAVEGRVLANEGAISTLQTAVGEGGSVADKIAAAVAAEKSAREAADATLQSGIDGVAGRATTLEGKMTAAEAAIAKKAEQSTLDALDDRVEAVEGVAAQNKKDIAANVTAIGTKADKTALQAEVERATGKEAELLAAVNLKAAQTDLQAETKNRTDADAALQAAIDAFIEIPESDINSLFNQQA